MVNLFLKGKHISKPIIDDDLKEYWQKINDEKRNEISKELEIYRREQLLDIKEDLLKMKLLVADQNKEYEHTFHKDREVRGIEIAKLDAEISAKKEILGGILEEKDKTIALLREALNNSLIGKKT